MARLAEINGKKKHLVVVCEGALSRLLSKSGHPFAIMTAYRGNLSKEQNIARNRDLRSSLNANRMGVHQLIGHYQEQINQSIPFEQSDRRNLRDVVERSYFVSKPGDMPFDDFRSIILKLASDFDQDSVVLGDGQQVKLVFVNGEVIDLGNRVSVNKIGQAYSQHIRKMNVPFVFEGIESPVSNAGRLGFARLGLLAPDAHEPTIDLMVEEILN